MPRSQEHSLITFDRNAAEFLFGRGRGRPTVSRVAGRAIARAAGMSVSDSTALFHGMLLVGGLTYLARRKRARIVEIDPPRGLINARSMNKPNPDALPLVGRHEQAPARDSAGMIHVADVVRPDGGDEFLDLGACIAWHGGIATRVNVDQPITCLYCLVRRK